MHILHVSQPTSEGVARWLTLLVEDQVKRGWTVTVASPVDGVLGKNVTYAGAEHLEWQAARSPGFSCAQEWKDLRSIVRRIQPDVVHLHSSKAGLVGRSVLRGNRPTLFSPHSWSFHAANGPLHTASRVWERLAARWTSKIICVSEAEKVEGLGMGVTEDSLVVVRNGVDLQTWRVSDDADRRRARSFLGVPPESPVVVCVGRLSEQKGQDLLLEAWPAVTALFPSAKLYLVGDGPAEAFLRASAESAESVHFAGASDAVDLWMAAASVVVFPSRWEGLALSVLEAAATGRYIVASDAAGMEEVIGTQTSAGGEIVRLGSAFPARLASAITQALNDAELADEIGLRARRRVEAHFDLHSSLDLTAEHTVLAIEGNAHR